MNSKEVTVVCATYNNSKTIERCLHSILKQDAIKNIMILIHDDASDDGTQKIIKSFCRDYPENIKAILQDQNQFSKGRKIFQEFMFPHIETDFIAICEGDDFWLDEKKISRQLSILKKNRNISLCFHDNLLYDHKHKTFHKNKEIKYGDKSRPVSWHEFVFYGSGSIPTNSILVRKKSINHIISTLMESPTSDYYIKLSGFMSNKQAFFINKKMSAYRTNNDDSWSGKVKEISPKNLINFFKKHIDTHLALNAEFNFKIIVLSLSRLFIYILGISVKQEFNRYSIFVCINLCIFYIFFLLKCPYVYINKKSRRV